MRVHERKGGHSAGIFTSSDLGVPGTEIGPPEVQRSMAIDRARLQEETPGVCDSPGQPARKRARL